MQSLQQISRAFFPASASFRIDTICVSVNRLRLMIVSLQVILPENSNFSMCHIRGSLRSPYRVILPENSTYHMSQIRGSLRFDVIMEFINKLF